MFGYMKLDSKCPNNLRKHYKKYYCFLCRSLEKHYGVLSRMILSYDVTFFMLFCSQADFLESISKIPCVKNDKELNRLIDNSIGHMCAAMNMLLVSAKLDDDILDEGKLSSRMIKSVYSHSIKRSEKDYPELAQLIYSGYSSFRNIESNHNSLEELENSFSDMMTGILTKAFKIKDDTRVNTLRAASKWLYYIDAIDDLDKDIKKNSFNPLKNFNSFEELRSKNYTQIFTHLSSVFDNCGIPDSKETNDLIINRLLFYSIPETTARILNRRISK